MDLEGVTANAVRLFKYLVPDYYEDLKRSTEAWVCKTVDVVPRAACQPHATAGQPQAAVCRILLSTSLFLRQLVSAGMHLEQVILSPGSASGRGTVSSGKTLVCSYY
jgi:hypothetical protein